MSLSISQYIFLRVCVYTHIYIYIYLERRKGERRCIFYVLLVLSFQKVIPQFEQTSCIRMVENKVTPVNSVEKGPLPPFCCDVSNLRSNALWRAMVDKSF